MRILIDVDGVVADLMGGFQRFFLERTGKDLRPRESTRHSISLSPAHVELHRKYNLDAHLGDFLRTPLVYQQYISLIPGARESIEAMRARGYEVGFVTATMWTAPQSYASKLQWLNNIFPGIPMLSVGSGEKHWVSGNIAIDDRFDTCQRWYAAGTIPLLFRQPWNEAPEGEASYDWGEIDQALGTR